MPLFDRLYLNVGAMKAGTTWLYRQLQQHPQIVFSREKELHYHARYDGDSQALNLQYRMQRARNAMQRFEGSRTSSEFFHLLHWYGRYLSSPTNNQWYRNRFPARTVSDQYCSDFSNLSAVVSDRTWNNIAELAQELKVSYVLRHPIGRIWSHIKFLRLLDRRPAGSGDVSVTELEAMDNEHGLWHHSHYSEHIARMRRIVGPENLKIVFYDDIRGRPEYILREIEEFLQIDPWRYEPERMDRKINASKKRAIPDFLFVFEDRCAQEVKALTELGLQVPQSWHY